MSDNQANNPKVSAEQQISRRTRRSFMVMGAGTVAGVAGWAALNYGGEQGDIPPALRGILGFNERVVRSAIYGNTHLTKTYPASAIGDIKENGGVGLDEDENLADWHLQVTPF